MCRNRINQCLEENEKGRLQVYLSNQINSCEVARAGGGERREYICLVARPLQDVRTNSTNNFARCYARIASFARTGNAAGAANFATANMNYATATIEPVDTG